MFLTTDRTVSAVCVIKLPTVCSQRGVPIIKTGYLKSRENGNPGMPIFTGCEYFHDNGFEAGKSFS